MGGWLRRLGRPARILPWLALALVLAFVARRFLPAGGSGPDGRAAPWQAPVVSPLEAADRVGKSAVVCGRVDQARYLPDVEGNPTFLNFGGRHPDQAFTAVIWGRHRSAFGFAPERAYRDTRLCVAGTVRRHEGTPQIEVRTPEQIRVRGQARPHGADEPPALAPLERLELLTAELGEVTVDHGEPGRRSGVFLPPPQPSSRGRLTKEEGEDDGGRPSGPCRVRNASRTGGESMSSSPQRLQRWNESVSS